MSELSNGRELFLDNGEIDPFHIGKVDAYLAVYTATARGKAAVVNSVDLGNYGAGPMVLAIRDASQHYPDNPSGRFSLNNDAPTVIGTAIDPMRSDRDSL